VRLSVTARPAGFCETSEYHLDCHDHLYWGRHADAICAIVHALPSELLGKTHAAGTEQSLTAREALANGRAKRPVGVQSVRLS